MTSYVPVSRAKAARLLSVAVLSAFGLTACETGFIPTEPPLLRSVSGFVRVPPEDVTRFVTARPGTAAAERLLDLVFPTANAEIFGMTFVPGATVELVRLDGNGEVIEVVGTTITNSSGQYGFTDSPVYSSSLAVRVLGTDPEADVIRAFVTGRNVDLTPASEAVVRSVVDDIVQAQANTPLTNFDVTEVSAIASLVAGLDIDVSTLDFETAVATIRAGAAPLLGQIATAFSSPGVDTRLHNAQFGGVDFVPVLKEPTAVGSGDGGIELRTDLANWGFTDLGLIGGGTIAPGTPHANHNLTTVSTVQSAGGTLSGTQHIVTDKGQVIVGDSAADASLGAVTGDGGFMVYPRTVLENSGGALGRGLRIAMAKAPAGRVMDNEAVDSVGGTDYHLVRLRENLSGRLGTTGENSVSVTAENGTVTFDGTASVFPPGGGSQNPFGTANMAVTASDQVLVDLENAVTRTSTPVLDPVPTIYQVIIDGTLLLERTNGAFLGQGYVTADGGLVSLQTSSNLIQVPINVLANDTAAFSSDNLAITSVTPDSLDGAITFSATGTQVLYTPPPCASSPCAPVTESFSYTIGDDAGGTATANVEFTVTSVNTPPTPVDDTYTVAARSVNVLDVLANDIENDIGQGLIIDQITPAVAELPTSGSNAIIAGSGTNNAIRYTPGFGWLGEESFQYKARDTQGGISTTFGNVTVTTVIDGENAPPVAADDAYAVAAGSADMSLDVLANDVDPDRLSDDANTGWTTANPWIEPVLSITSPDPDGTPVATANGGTVSQSGGNLIYTPPAAFSGTDVFTYTISDGVDQDVATVNVAVVANGNLPPLAVEDSYRVAADSTNNVFTVLDNDSDPQLFDTLTISAVDATTPAGASVAIDGDTLVYTPQAGVTGPDSFTYTLSDAAGAVSIATVSVVVGGANAAPDAVSDEVRVRTGTDTVLDVLANDSDPDLDDTIFVSAVESPTAQGGTVALALGVVTYTPPPGSVPDGGGDPAPFTGQDSFTYTVSDGNGGESEATVSVQVMAADGNNAPVAGDDGVWYLPMNDGSVTTPYTLDVLANDVDLDPGDTLTVNGVFQGNAAGTLSNLGAAGIGYIPATGFTGTDTFTYSVSDGHGGADTATVTIGVLDPASSNTPPRALDDGGWRVPVNGTRTLDVLANDRDADVGDTLTIVAVNSAEPGTPGDALATQHGSAVISGGTLLYTPATDYVGDDVFNYTVRDSAGAAAVASVTVSVNNANLPPVTVPDAFHVGLNTVTSFPVLANDFDPNLGQTLTLSTTLGTPDQGGSVAITGTAGGVPVNTQVTYKPAANFRGVEHFTYTAIDGNGGETTGTVTVTVTGGNSPPAGNDDTFTVRSNGTDMALDVLGNDVDTDVDDVLTIVDVGATANGGTATVSEDGTRVLYTPPNPGFEGTDSFSYTLRDSRGVTSTAEVDLTVSATAANPVALDDTGLRLVLPSDPAQWTTNLAQREIGIAIRKTSGLNETRLNGTYNLVEHTGYVFAEDGDPSLGAGYTFGTVAFDGEGGINGGTLFSRRIGLDVNEARTGNPANSLLIVPLPPEAQAVSGSYDVSGDGGVEMNIAFGDTVISGLGAVSENGEVVAVAVRVQEGGDDSGRGLLFLVRQPGD